MRFTKSKLYDELTIVMVCRNWESLHYPFIEAIWASMPLGCRYLIGVFDTTDNTMDYLKILGEHVPIEIYNGKWQYKSKLKAIGIATHEVWQQAKTTARFNLQGNEVLTDDSPQKIIEFFDKNWPSPIAPHVHGGVSFLHFWGSFSFEAVKIGAAYCNARRIGNAGDNYTNGSGDGAYPSPTQATPTGATIHRYAYCFDNQIEMKKRNHIKLFSNLDENAIKKDIDGCKGLRNRPNYDGGHPSYVQHLKDKRNYNIDESLRVFLAAVS